MNTRDSQRLSINSAEKTRIGQPLEGRAATAAVWTFCRRPKGEQRLAQGFSPGNHTHNGIALKGRPNRVLVANA